MDRDEPAVRDFSSVRRVVVKVGTSLLRKSDGTVDLPCLRNIADQVAQIRAGSGGGRKADAARQVVIVSSGAVGFGMLMLGMSRRPDDTATLQAAAAVGQPRLMEAWSEAFASHRIRISQLLLTNDGLQERRRFLNAKNALVRLLELDVVPVVNENDTVTVEELKFGDNDALSALVAAMMDADLLVNLTDVDGFYAPADKDRRDGPLLTVPAIRPEWISATSASERGSRKRGYTMGGMSAKLRAARIALASGIPVIIANGRAPGILPSLLAGRPQGTLFLPHGEGLKGKKVWLSFFPSPQGAIVVDRGAVTALVQNGRSLLASGIVRADGRFERKSCVSVVTDDGCEIARGISFYSSDEIGIIARCPSSDIRRRLGLAAGDEAPPEVIHRDNLAVIH